MKKPLLVVVYTYYYDSLGVFESLMWKSMMHRCCDKNSINSICVLLTEAHCFTPELFLFSPFLLVDCTVKWFWTICFVPACS